MIGRHNKKDSPELRHSLDHATCPVLDACDHATPVCACQPDIVLENLTDSLRKKLCLVSSCPTDVRIDGEDRKGYPRDFSAFSSDCVHVVRMAIVKIVKPPPMFAQVNHSKAHVSGVVPFYRKKQQIS